jgi:hypothetical protein
MKRLSVLLFAAILAVGSMGTVTAHPAHERSQGKGQGLSKVYHCHQPGNGSYVLLHLPMAAASKENVHGNVEIRIGADRQLLCPDDDSYDDSKEVYDHGH